jgi:hypothetical protein
MKTLNEVRREGLEALRKKLGRADMIRFLRQFETGSGDYSTSRHAWVDETSLEDIKAASKRIGKSIRRTHRK